jgi:prepilin-type N-terminal cleavage/methylation domain-containing protein
MTFSKLKTMKKDRGFTIVELLIVIVVIAILAAIVIVAYNGVQNRARDTNNKTDAVSIAKVAEAINADTGSYPTGTDSATLVTSFGTSTTAKLPTGVTVKFAAAAPTESVAESDANLTTHTYSVKVCAGGLNVYYPSRSANAVQTQKVGADCGA